MIRSSAAIAALMVMVAGIPTSSAAPGGESDSKPDPVKALVGRLDLEKYKATIKGLTRFGDRRQGTDRNRAAVDWIEAQLKNYGCANISRIKYTYSPTETRRPSGPPVAPDAAQGGGRYRGVRAHTGVNTDAQLQPDEKLRALNQQPTEPGEREEVYCTKVGSTHPEEMYIVGGHMDGHGWGEAANDDGSGTALVMELARVFSSPDVKTERSIRFALWNNEETGLNGARAYVDQRAPLQGKGRSTRIGPLSGTEVAGHGTARHDALRSRHAAAGRHALEGPAARSGREH